MEQEKKNSLGELMKITMEHIKTMADANTIIGAPIQAEGVTLIPVSRMSFGMGGGGTEFTTKSGAPKEGFGGGSAASAKLEPVAFLIVREDGLLRSSRRKRRKRRPKEISRNKKFPGKNGERPLHTNTID